MESDPAPAPDFWTVNHLELSPSEVVLVEEDEILVLGLDEVLPTGVGVLAIGFVGTLNDQMEGFYWSIYEHNGEKKNMTVTQFEPTNARRYFSCWDEATMKAVFKITLVVPTELVALSNMPVTEEKVDGLVKSLYFQESPIMSSYLVAIVVGLFNYVEDVTPDGMDSLFYHAFQFFSPIFFNTCSLAPFLSIYCIMFVQGSMSMFIVKLERVSRKKLL